MVLLFLGDIRGRSRNINYPTSIISGVLFLQLFDRQSISMTFEWPIPCYWNFGGWIHCDDCKISTKHFRHGQAEGIGDMGSCREIAFRNCLFCFVSSLFSLLHFLCKAFPGLYFSRWRWRLVFSMVDILLPLTDFCSCHAIGYWRSQETKNEMEAAVIISINWAVLINSEIGFSNFSNAFFLSCTCCLT